MDIVTQVVMQQMLHFVLHKEGTGSAGLTVTATQLHKVEKHGHCCGHSMNLAVANVVKQSIRYVLNTVGSILPSMIVYVKSYKYPYLLALLDSGIATLFHDGLFPSECDRQL